METSPKFSCTKESLFDSVRHHLKYSQIKRDDYNENDLYQSLALSIRDRLIDGLIRTNERFVKSGAKRVCYLSMEFLIGRLLSNNLINLGLYETCREVLNKLGANLEEIVENEPDAALGNGGLGRLAACYLDSMASQDIFGTGYGINYEFGLFKQEINNGYQVEKPDRWFCHESPWMVKRADKLQYVPLYGKIVHEKDKQGNYNPMWLDWKLVAAMPYDMPIVGYGGTTVNSLRLFTALSSLDFDMNIFNSGDYIEAVRQKIDSETISKILYPKDSFEKGRELRLIQEYFLVACSVRDIFSNFLQDNSEIHSVSDQVAVQLNDTHPSLTVAEIMRLLIDEKAIPWEEAWSITRKTCAVTNHTLLPEALETWSTDLLEKVLPRHMQIIYEINRRFFETIEMKFPGDNDKKQKLSIITQEENKRVRMINLAVAGSHSINGVAALHSKLVKEKLLPDFHEMYPDNFHNVTNGITPRRWLLNANPKLAAKISECIGDSWITNLDKLSGLTDFTSDSSFLSDIEQIKLANKEKLASIIEQSTGITVDPTTIFDVQAKRFHEYKRQLLNVMRIIYEYLLIKDDRIAPSARRTYIFSGKAAPGYYQAKLIIKLINNLASFVNNDPQVSKHIQVVFIPDYRVTLAERIIPATDISEQISTTGMEASGTGNMKFALNGALTIGTYDGANIEIAEEVGEENIFIFGLRTEDIAAMKRDGYDPWQYYHDNEPVRRVLDSLKNDRFCPESSGLFAGIFDELLNHGNPYFLLADFPAYLVAQEMMNKEYLNKQLWFGKTAKNIAGMGKFSSDRSVKEYAEKIWHL